MCENRNLRTMPWAMKSRSNEQEQDNIQLRSEDLMQSKETKRMAMLSIVSTLYQSEKTIQEFILRCLNASKELGIERPEIVLVNDGSTDKSLEIAIETLQSQEQAKGKIVDLSRNFGHHKALMTGIKHAEGEEIFLIDSDLEESPELLLQLYRERRRLGCDVAYGAQRVRRGGLREKMTGSLFYFLFRTLSGLNFPENVLTARIMTRRYAEALLMHQEYEPYLIGLWAITGFTQHQVFATKSTRNRSRYTLKKKIRLAVNSIASFTDRPLKATLYAGLLSFATFLAFTGLQVSVYFVTGSVPEGWTSIFLSIWGFGSVIVAMLSVNALYLSKIYIETKRRPYVIEKAIVTTNY